MRYGESGVSAVVVIHVAGAGWLSLERCFV